MICQRCSKGFDGLDTHFLMAGPSINDIYTVCPECKGEFLAQLRDGLTSIIHNSMPLGESAQMFRERAEMYARREVC